MAITIDQESMKFLPTADPDIIEVMLEYTKDDLATVDGWTASWRPVTFMWSRNSPAADFMAAVQAAITATRDEKTEQKSIKTAVIAATSQCKKVTRTDPAAKPAFGTSADNPFFVKVV